MQAQEQTHALIVEDFQAFLTRIDFKFTLNRKIEFW